MIRVAALALLLASAAQAQEAGPQVSVAIDPQGPVTVGTPVAVSVTLLVPTFMPSPPVWPDLQIADAITRLPERATRPVTERRGAESWSGLVRTWEIVPQRAADFDLGPLRIDATYADPQTSAPVRATVAVPDIAFTATVPAGAEGMDPFVAATSLGLDATVAGLPDEPKPGDAFTLTLTTTAAGPPAMLLPPLAARLPDLPGLRAYPRQPVLADGPPATRIEAVAYVIEQPGEYRIPALTLDWWNAGTAARETAATQPIAVSVPAPPGWRPPGDGAAAAHRRWPVMAVVVVAAVAAATVLLYRRRPRPPRPPSEAELYRGLRRAIREAPAGAVHQSLAAWRAALAASPTPEASGAVDHALAALDRLTYAPGAVHAGSESRARNDLLRAVRTVREARDGHQLRGQLPPLNPV